MLHRFNPNRADFTPYGFTCVRWQPTLMPVADRHDEIELNFLVRGKMQYAQGGQLTWVETRTLTAFWAAIPHQIVAHTQDAELLVATVPLSWFLSWPLPLNCLQKLLGGGVLFETDASQADIDAIQFPRWVEQMEGNDEYSLQLVLTELKGRIMRLCLSESNNNSTRLRKDSEAKATTMASFIAQNYQHPITISDIAAATDLHPNYAMTLFKSIFGMTLNAYLNTLRVSHAQHLLITTHNKILDVSISSGFGSLSRFNHVFQQHTGVAPSRFRKEHAMAPKALRIS